MKIENAATVFRVASLPDSLQWYTQVLGFQKTFEFPQYAGVMRDSCFIHLSQRPEGDVSGNSQIYIICDEVDEYCKEIARKGAKIGWQPRDQPYLLRDFMTSDPSGNALYFGRFLGEDND